MKSLFISIALFSAMLLGAQSKFTETTIEVDGLCGMCESRIENAAYLPGVKKADWDRETHQLTLAFRNDKISQEEIIASINEVGHDVKDQLATDEQYAKIHGCCRYRDADLRASHGLGAPLCKPDETHVEQQPQGGKQKH